MARSVCCFGVHCCLGTRATNARDMLCAPNSFHGSFDQMYAHAARGCASGKSWLARSSGLLGRSCHCHCHAEFVTHDKQRTALRGSKHATLRQIMSNIARAIIQNAQHQLSTYAAAPASTMPSACAASRTPTSSSNSTSWPVPARIQRQLHRGPERAAAARCAAGQLPCECQATPRRRRRRICSHMVQRATMQRYAFDGAAAHVERRSARRTRVAL